MLATLLNTIVIPPVSPLPSYERISNGDFAGGDTGWTDPEEGWDTSLGNALTTADGSPFYQNLTESLIPGKEYRLFFDVGSNAGNAVFTVSLYSGGALVQTLASSAYAAASSNVIAGIITATGDRVQVTATGGGGNFFSFGNISLIT